MKKQIKEQKGKANCNGGFEIHYITDENNKEGKLFKYVRWTEDSFYIKAKTREEATEILNNWDNNSLIDEVAEWEDGNTEPAENDAFIDEEQEYNEYSQTHTIYRDDEEDSNE